MRVKQDNNEAIGAVMCVLSHACVCVCMCASLPFLNETPWDGVCGLIAAGQTLTHAHLGRREWFRWLVGLVGRVGSLTGKLLRLRLESHWSG